MPFSFEDYSRNQISDRLENVTNSISSLNLLVIGGSTVLGSLNHPSFVTQALQMEKGISIRKIAEPNIRLEKVLGFMRQMPDLHFDYCVVQLGSGDSQPVNKFCRRRKSEGLHSKFIKWVPFVSVPNTSPAKYLEKLEELIQCLNDHNVPVIWIVTLLGNSRHIRYRNLRKLYCAELPKSCRAKLFGVIDLNELLTGPEVSSDRVHPSFLGQQKILQTLKEYFFSTV